MEIILASGSPRRRELLEQIGVKNYRTIIPDVDEHVEGRPAPEELVELLSRRKAEAVGAKAGPDALVIAADTVVALDGAILGKPHSREDAAAMLAALSGRKHAVYTGLTVLRGERTVTGHERTAVTFRALTWAEIDHYVATGEPLDKAGAYGIQGVGALFITGIEGDYFNVMGLPVCRLGRVLASFGVDALALAAGHDAGNDSQSSPFRR